MFRRRSLPRRKHLLFGLRPDRRRVAERRLAHERLEPRLNLSITGFPGNECPPDLNLSAIDTQTALVGQELVLNLLTAGGTVTDVDGSGVATGDVIRLLLDPDDTPAGATMTAGGVFRWTPTAEQLGTFQFVVIAVDSGSPPLADAEVFYVAVNPNHAPDLAAISDTAASVGELFEMTVTATDADGDNLTFTLDRDDPNSTIPASAVLQQTNNNTAVIRWTPEEGDAGAEYDFSVLVTDDGFPPLADRETFTLSVMTVAAQDDSYVVEVNNALEVNAASGVLANDTDFNGDTLTASVVAGPAHGALLLDADGSFAYSPVDDFHGTDTFTYRAQDDSGDFSEADVTIVVNTSPAAMADSYTTGEDTALTVGIVNGVLLNDVDPDGDLLMASLVSNAAHGVVALNSGRTFVYTPNANYFGSDSFIYRANDGIIDSSDATVSIFVNPVNDAPIAAGDSYTTDEDQTLAVSAGAGVLENDSDIENDDLTAVLVDSPAHGDLTLNNDGSFSYTPDANFHGTDQFTYRASDGDEESEATTVSITVHSLNDPPDAIADEYSVNFNSQLVVDAPSGVLANDTDADGDALTAALVQNVAHGTLDFHADGSFTYAPSEDFIGDDTFIYTASDGAVSPDDVTVTIHVVDPNAFSIAENSAAGTLVGQLSALSDLGAGVLYSIDDPNLDDRLQLAADDHISGNLAGSVVLVEYADFECPVCRAYDPIVEQLISDFSDELMVVTRHFPLATISDPPIHQNSFKAAIAAEAAGRQGAFEAYTNLLFANQSEWKYEQGDNDVVDPTPFFRNYAEDLALNLTQFDADLADQALVDRVQRDLNAVLNLGGTGTPTFFLNGSRLATPATSVALSEMTGLIQSAMVADESVFNLNRQTGELFVRDSEALDFETMPNFTLTINAVGASGNETFTATVHLTDVAEAAPLTSLDAAFAGDSGDGWDLLDGAL